MRIFNRRARFDYHLLEKFEAGVVLSGAEVKSAKAGHVSLEGAFVQLRDGEAWLTNAHIHPYPFADNRDYEPRRSRKLLLNKNELLKITQRTTLAGLTIIPVSCYTKANKIKIEIALARGKKEFEKRETIKKRDLEREVEKTLGMKRFDG